MLLTALLKAPKMVIFYSLDWPNRLLFHLRDFKTVKQVEEMTQMAVGSNKRKDLGIKVKNSVESAYLWSKGIEWK